MTGITSVEGITRIGRSKRNDVEYYIVTVWILRGKLTRVKLILHFTYTALLPRIISRARLFSIVVSSSNEPELYRKERESSVDFGSRIYSLHEFVPFYPVYCFHTNMGSKIDRSSYINLIRRGTRE